jgi:hypothetical protein
MIGNPIRLLTSPIIELDYEQYSLPYGRPPP